MKRELFFLSVFALVLSLSLVSSFDIPLTKTTFYPGETMQLEIPNIFIDAPLTSNILVYKKGAVHSSPAESGIIKYDNKYHFYALLPTSPGDYQLRIEGVRYWDGSVQSEQTITTDFSIVSTNVSYLSFNPGYIYASKSFTITIKSYNADQEVKVDFPEIGFSDSYSLGYGDSKNIYFQVNEIKEKLKSNIQINGYTLPIVLLATSSSTSNTTTSTSEGNSNLGDLIALDTEKIEATIMPDLDYYYQIVAVNKDSNVRGIKLSSSSDEIKISPSYIETLYKEEILNITVNSKTKLDGYIKLETNNSFLKIPIIINITAKEKDTITNIPSVNEEKTCAKLGGLICISGETCTGSRTASIDSREGNCCIGNCKVPGSSSSTWLWGLLILFLVAIGAWFLYKKANQGEGPEFLQKMFKKQEDKYQRRMNPQPLQPSPEVRRSLDKI